MKKVIITGITGQDGSYMADYLLDTTEHEIFGMVRRVAHPNYTNIQYALKNPRFKLVTADLSDSQSIEAIVREIQPDYLLNFGAQSFVSSSWQLPEHTFEVGAIGVLRCLESIRKFAPKCRFYSAGSSEEMGDAIYSPQDINHPIRPRSPYAAAKAAARHIVKVWRDSYNLYAVHCILYNHESERRGPEFVTRKITQNVARIQYALSKNEKFEPLELGNMSARRDWSHARDFVKGIWLAMNQPVLQSTDGILHPMGTLCGTELPPNFKPKDYILSSGENHSIKEFVNEAFGKAGIIGYWDGEGVDEKFILTDAILDEKTGLKWTCNLERVIGVQVNPKFYRPAEVDALIGDSTPARTELGWKPEISFDKLVDCMVSSDLDEYRHRKETEKIKQSASSHR